MSPSLKSITKTYKCKFHIRYKNNNLFNVNNFVEMHFMSNNRIKYEKILFC